MEVCDKVFRYVIEKDMGFTFNTYLEFQENYLSHPNIIKKYYQRLSGSPIYQNLVSFAIMWISSRKCPSLKMLANIKIPWIHLAYSAIPLVYFSISREWKINKPQLRQAGNTLKLFTDFHTYQYNLSAWDHLKDITYQTWNAIK